MQCGNGHIHTVLIVYLRSALSLANVSTVKLTQLEVGMIQVLTLMSKCAGLCTQKLHIVNFSIYYSSGQTGYT